MSDLWVAPEIVIPQHELEYRATRSSGPGGQHVNRSATRVELWWNLETTTALTADQVATVRQRLGRRVKADGSIRLVSQRFRSQQRNKEDAAQRLAALVGKALTPRKARKATKPTKASREQRIRGKKKRSELKKLRQPPDLD